MRRSTCGSVLLPPSSSPSGPATFSVSAGEVGHGGARGRGVPLLRGGRAGAAAGAGAEQRLQVAQDRRLEVGQDVVLALDRVARQVGPVVQQAVEDRLVEGLLRVDAG